MIIGTVTIEEAATGDTHAAAPAFVLYKVRPDGQNAEVS